MNQDEKLKFNIDLDKQYYVNNSEILDLNNRLRLYLIIMSFIKNQNKEYMILDEFTLIEMLQNYIYTDKDRLISGDQYIFHHFISLLYKILEFVDLYFNNDKHVISKLMALILELWANKEIKLDDKQLSIIKTFIRKCVKIYEMKFKLDNYDLEIYTNFRNLFH